LKFILIGGLIDGGPGFGKSSVTEGGGDLIDGGPGFGISGLSEGGGDLIRGGLGDRCLF